MVDQLSSFAAEVTRVAQGPRPTASWAARPGARGVGTWRRLTDNVNRHGVEPDCSAIDFPTAGRARRPCRKKITVARRARILQLKETINTVVDQLNSFAGEVTASRREVGTEGKLGGPADVKGGSGSVEGPHRQRELHGLNFDLQVRGIGEASSPRWRTATCARPSVNAKARSPSWGDRSTT